MVWLVDTEARSLELHRVGAPPQTLRGGDILESGVTLPGFRLPLHGIFPDP